ncbi:MAG: protein-disulfide reductase DsbD domain-containing protein [Phyllobacterium sp.]
MKTFIVTPIFALALSSMTGIAAVAESSAWTEVDGGRVRLVIESAEHPSDELRGIVQIDLKPGWKTYWREPGSAGVPPQIDLTGSVNINSADIAFPAPYRFDEGDAAWTGYKKSVSLPVVFKLDDKADETHLRGYVFLGICETICIPVQVPFDMNVQAGVPDVLSRTLVNAAFARLPEAATPEFRITQAIRDGERFRFYVNLPDDAADADLFLATADAPIGMSRLEKRDGKTAVFTVPITASHGKPDVRAHYTLKQGGKAVSGEIVIP